MRFKALFSLVCLSVALGSPAQASLLYAGFPAPGNNTYTPSGGPDAVDPGGLTFTYSNFDPTHYSSLYFVVDASNYAPDLYQSSPPNGPGTLTYNAGLSSFASGVLAFTGSTTITSGEYGNVVTGTELLVTLGGGSGLPLISAGSLGVPLADGAALNVGAGPFTANFEFLMSNSICGSNEAASTCYSVLHGGGSGESLQSDFAGGFYYTAPVPLPAASWLLLSGLGGFGLLSRRRRRAI